MEKSKNVKKELEDINKKIDSLELKKKKLMRQENMVFCRQCNKFYPGKKCRQGPEMSGPILEAWWVTCPKGHTWDDK